MVCRRGEVSERQWADITGVLATSPKIGTAYLRRWATELGVERLLDKALVQTRPGDASDHPQVLYLDSVLSPAGAFSSARAEERIPYMP